MLIEKRRQPVQIEPEHRRGQRVGEGEGPSAAHAQDLAERHASLFRFDLLLDVIEFRLFHRRVIFRIEILQAPEQQPDAAECRHAQERRLPAPHMQDQWQQHRREHRADVGAGVENAGSDCTLTGREPQARGLHAGRIVGRFRQTEDEAADHEADCRGRQAMGAGRQAPEQHGAEEHALDADPVDQASLQDKTDRVADLKPEVDVGVIHRRPAHFLGEDRLHDAEGGAVDVVEGGGKKHQRQHAPAGLADSHGAADLVANATRGSAHGRSHAGSL